MSVMIRKESYADGRAFRYQISDDDRDLRYLGDWVGRLLPSATRLVEFYDVDHNLCGRLQPSHAARWRRPTNFEVFVGEDAGDAHAVVQQRWNLVDALLLRLPRYVLRLQQLCFIFQGTRYGQRFYEIFRRHLSGEGEETIDEDQGEEGRMRKTPRNPVVGTRRSARSNIQ